MGVPKLVFENVEHAKEDYTEYRAVTLEMSESEHRTNQVVLTAADEGGFNEVEAALNVEQVRHLNNWTSAWLVGK